MAPVAGTTWAAWGQLEGGKRVAEGMGTVSSPPVARGASRPGPLPSRVPAGLRALEEPGRHPSHLSLLQGLRPFSSPLTCLLPAARQGELVSPVPRALRCLYTTWQVPGKRWVDGGLTHSRCLVCV